MILKPYIQLFCFVATLGWLNGQDSTSINKLTGFGYLAPIESSNLEGVISHSAYMLKSLIAQQKWYAGVNIIAGADLQPNRSAIQNMIVVQAFFRLLIQTQQIKAYGQIASGPGFYRIKKTKNNHPNPSENRKNEWENYPFFNINFGGGVDIPIGNKDWFAGITMDYALAGHKEGIGGFFTPRIGLTRYFKSKR